MTDSDDEQLNLALALSMQSPGTTPSRQKPPKSSGAVVDLTTGSDDDQQIPKTHNNGRPKKRTQAGPALESEELALRGNAGSRTQSNNNNEPGSSNQEVAMFGILGFDRKKMEQERLARRQKLDAQKQEKSLKRKASISPPPLRREMKLSKPANNTTPMPTTPSAFSSIKDALRPDAPSVDLAVTPPKICRTTEEKVLLDFPDGIVKKTWASGFPRNGDIKIEEVLQKSDLQLAVLSSFQWDMDWLLDKIDVGKTDIIFVMQAKEDSTKRQYEAEVAAMPRTRVCCPPMDSQVQCMHSKLMLLFHPTYLRIAIPTANLVPYDYGENGGVMENTVFLIDLPLLANGSDVGNDPPMFYHSLAYFCNAMRLQEDAIQRLSGFDFSKTKNLAFVHTIGGSHGSDAWKRTGFSGLGTAVTSLGLNSSQSLQLDYVTSSVGSLNYEFMHSLYRACQGDNGKSDYSSRASLKKRAKESDPEVSWRDKFCVYFPTRKTVLESKGGPQYGGTICTQSRWFNKADFPRDAMRDCVSLRPGMLMHNKILFVRFEKGMQMKAESTDGSRCWGFVVIGSANLSESAWGRLVQDRSTKAPKLNCRNWECGVLVPIMASPDNLVHGPQCKDEPQIVGLDVCGSRVPVPMVVPGRTYDGEVPWYYTE